MKKVAALLIIFGSGLAAFGFSGWQADGHTGFLVESSWTFAAGWPLHSQIEMTIGITLLAWGVMLRKDSK
jgi:hypothetical protein